MRPAAFRQVVSPASVRLASRPATVTQARLASLRAGRSQIRTYASAPETPAASNTAVLIAIGLLGVGGFFYLKPIRDVAVQLNKGVEAVKETATEAQDKAKELASTAGDKVKGAASAVGVENAGDAMEMAQSLFPTSAAFAIISPVLTTVTSSGGGDGLLSKLENADLTKALDGLKNNTNDQIKQIVQSVQDRLKEADNQVKNVNWKGLSKDLKKQLPEESQKYVDFLIGYIPTTDDVQKYFDKAKEYGKDQLKGIDAAADKINKRVEKAAKDGKDKSEAWVEGVKGASEDEIKQFKKQMRSYAEYVGVGRERVDEWFKAGEETAEDWANTVQSRANQAVSWFPVDEDEVVKQVSDVSPALGKMLKEIIDDGKETAERGKKALDDGAKKVEKEADKAKNTAKDAAKDVADKAGDKLKKAAK